jgi:hypothetical protein
MITRVKGKKILKNMPTDLKFSMTKGELFTDTISKVEKHAEKARELMVDLNFVMAFKEIQEIVYLGNFELSDHEFWLLAKS